jgi:hypothetical protein
MADEAVFKASVKNLESGAFHFSKHDIPPPVSTKQDLKPVDICYRYHSVFNQAGISLFPNFPALTLPEGRR